MKTFKILFTIGFLFTATSLVAQSRHFNAQTLGMGNGGTAFIDGNNANFLNPANLMINNSGRKPKREIGISGLGIQAFGSLLNLDVYDKYLTNGDIIEGELRENMLNDWFDNGNHSTLSFNTNVDVVPLGFSNRGNKYAFSFATRFRSLNTAKVNKGYMDLLWYGFDSKQFKNGEEVNFSFNTLSFSEISVGFAMELPIPLMDVTEMLPFVNGMKVYAGIAPKYMIGFQAIDFNFNSNLKVDPVAVSNQAITHTFDYSLESYGDISELLGDFVNARKTNPAAKLNDFFDYSGSDSGSLGSAFALDLGVTAEMDVSIPSLNILGDRQILRVSMSLTDIGKVSFDDRPSVVSDRDTFVFDGDAGDMSTNDYFDNISDSLENDVYVSFDSDKTGKKKYDLPSMFNFGAALTLGKLTTTLDYGYASNDVGKTVKGSSLALGLEYRFINFIPIRFGTRYGDKSTVYSFGTGLDFRNFTLTTGLMAVNDASKGVGISAAYSGLVFRF